MNTSTQLESYQQQKTRHSKEFSDFKGIFFAFSRKQLEEGKEKVGAKDNSDLFDIGAGGFVLKDRLQACKDLFKKQENERKELMKDTKTLIGALVYELANHEYGYTGDPSDALSALGLTVDTVDPKVMKKAMKKAIKKY